MLELRRYGLKTFNGQSNTQDKECMIFIRDRPNKNWERLEARVSGDTSSNTSSGLYLEGWSGYVEWNGFQPKISSAETLVVLLPCCRNEMGKRDKRVVRLSMLLWQLEDMKVYFLFCRSCLCLFTSWQVSILSIFMNLKVVEIPTRYLMNYWTTTSVWLGMLSLRFGSGLLSIFSIILFQI